MLLISKFLDRLPYIGKLRADTRAMRAMMGRYPAGHYYSPIPGDKDIRRQLEQHQPTISNHVTDVGLNADAQFLLLHEYVQYYSALPWNEQRQKSMRYYFGQEWFCYADAIFLYSHLRHTSPGRIVEVGSGFSSALMLDTSEQFLSNRPAITLIEPYPDRLIDLLLPGDLEQITVIKDEVQNVPTSVFSLLKAGDLLFIDSSHVVKAGSDLHFLFFNVIPQLAPGVIVHFHDIFYPFEYPADWLSMGRYWNEAYFLRAFMAYNSEWQIRFFNSYIGSRYQDYLIQYMPLCLKNTGGSIYIERARNEGNPASGV